MQTNPVPENELERILQLSDLNIDYTAFGEQFNGLARLAAKVAGTDISLINLIDSYTQWTVSGYGLDIQQMDREDSVCQYTIIGDTHFEVNDLKNDERFHDKFYVAGSPHLRYYYGVPLKYGTHNLGALCVLDGHKKELSPEKAELLKLIADEIVNRLRVHKYIEDLRIDMKHTQHVKNKVVHDIRGPISGIIGLSEILRSQGKANSIDQVMDFVSLIYKSGKSLLELADDILETEKGKADVKSNELTLGLFAEKLEQLYGPQAKSKNILLTLHRVGEEAAFPQARLLQIAGNLISNAIKFTPRFGSVEVTLELAKTGDASKTLSITVNDNGAGMNEETLAALNSDEEITAKEGTTGEKGFGFGLALVKHLVNTMNGTMTITSQPGKGSQFNVVLPDIG